MSNDIQKPMQFLTLKETAKKWHTNSGYLRKACELGQVDGAAKLGDEWIFPADMERPPMKVPRDVPSSVPNEIQHGSDYKDIVYNSTMEGFPSFLTITEEIGGTIYTVTGSFSPTATETLEEKMARLYAREIGKEFGLPYLSLDEKTKQEIRKEALSKLPSNEEARAIYREKFVEIGFNDGEVAELMAKIDEHLATRDDALAKRERRK